MTIILDKYKVMYPVSFFRVTIISDSFSNVVVQVSRRFRVQLMSYDAIRV